MMGIDRAAQLDRRQFIGRRTKGPKRTLVAFGAGAAAGESFEAE